MWTYFVQCSKLTFFLNYDLFSLFSILRIPSIFHFILLRIIQSPYTLLFTIEFSKRGQPDSWWGQPDFYQQVVRWATLFFLELLRHGYSCINFRNCLGCYMGSRSCVITTPYHNATFRGIWIYLLWVKFPLAYQSLRWTNWCDIWWFIRQKYLVLNDVSLQLIRHTFVT